MCEDVVELAYSVWTSCPLLQDELQHRGKSIHGDVGGVGDSGCYVLCWIDGAKSNYALRDPLAQDA